MNRRNFIIDTGKSGVGLVFFDLGILKVFSGSKHLDTLNDFLHITESEMISELPENIYRMLDDDFTIRSCFQTGFVNSAASRFYKTENQIYLIPLEQRDQNDNLINFVISGYYQSGEKCERLPVITRHYAESILSICNNDNDLKDSELVNSALLLPKRQLYHTDSGKMTYETFLNDYSIRIETVISNNKELTRYWMYKNEILIHQNSINKSFQFQNSSSPKFL